MWARPHGSPSAVGRPLSGGARGTGRRAAGQAGAPLDDQASALAGGELDRLRETIEVLTDTELVRDLREGIADARAGRVFSAGQIAADLAARRAAGE